MNYMYIPKHTRDHADVSSYVEVAREGTQFIGNKLINEQIDLFTNKQTYIHSILYINTDDRLIKTFHQQQQATNISF